MMVEVLSALIGTEVRAVQLDIPKQDVDIFRQMGDFKECNLDIEAPDVIKFIYGLKVAPRAWNKCTTYLYSGSGADSYMLNASYMWYMLINTIMEFGVTSRLRQAAQSQLSEQLRTHEGGNTEAEATAQAQLPRQKSKAGAGGGGRPTHTKAQ